jgi:hypothetical protein
MCRLLPSVNFLKGYFMNSAIKAAIGLIFAFSAAARVYAAPDITSQTIPFNVYAQDAYPSISADGRYVAFDLEQRGSGSYPSNIYIQDLSTGQRIQANLTLAGAPAPMAAFCRNPSMDANGRFVVFGCVATYMGSTTYGGYGMFVYDRETNSTQMIPDTGDDKPSNNYGSAISADGRFVAFRTLAATGNAVKIYVRDLVNKTTSITNAQATFANSSRMSISKDGRYIAYLGKQTLAASALNVSVYDRVSGVTEAIDIRADGSRSGGNPADVSMSDDGSVVAFVSNDANLVSPPTVAGANQVYVRDRKTGTTERISVGSGINYAVISGNGRYVAYLQTGFEYVYDRLTKVTRKIVLTGYVATGTARFSTNGRYLAFSSSLSSASQSLSIADLGAAAGVSLSTNQLSLTEGGTAGTYTMALTQAPDADVKITAATGAQLSLARSELTFTTVNWSTPQVVSVTAVADGKTEGTHSAAIVHTVSSDDVNYRVVQTSDVTVTISDGIVPTIVTPGATWIKTEMPLTGTAAPGSTVLLTASNRSTGWLSSVSTVADAQGKWSYTLSGYTDGILDLDAQADGVKSVVRSVTVTLTVTPPAPTYVDVTGYIRTTAVSMAYNRVTGKYVGNFMLTNTGSISLAGPLQVQFDGLTAGITLDNASASHDGSPYITVPAGLAPDESVTIPLVFDNPARVAIGYSAKIYSGSF